MSDDINQQQKEFEEALRDMSQIFNIRNSVDEAGEDAFSMDLAMEADVIVPNKSILSIYMSTQSKSQKYSLAVESIHEKIVDAVVRVYNHIVKMIKSFIAMLMKPFSSNKKDIAQTNEIVMDVVKDHQLQIAMKDIDGFVADAQSVATEDMLNPSKLTNISINDIYEKFVDTLSDPEVDFLTSGHRYKTIKNVVDSYIKGHYPEFISDMSGAIQKWVEDGLQEAPHIGKAEDSVKRFMTNRESLLSTVNKNHKETIEGLRELEKLCGSNTVNTADRARLHVFLKTPSMLFPHIERMLESVRFERISDSERKLISNLEKIRQHFEADVRHIQMKLNSDIPNWPAQEAVLKAAQRANREMLENIAALTKVSLFIKHSAEVAFHTTSKAFSYVINILREVQRLPNIDRDKVKECVEIVQSRRRKLDGLTSFA